MKYIFYVFNSSNPFKNAFSIIEIYVYSILNNFLRYYEFLLNEFNAQLLFMYTSIALIIFLTFSYDNTCAV